MKKPKNNLQSLPFFLHTERRYQDISEWVLIENL
jgi:hypothetical protein